MPVTPRTQTQDLSGAPTVTPAANFRDSSFIVRPGKLKIDSNSFSSLSARFAQLATARKIDADDEQFELGLAEVQELGTVAEADRNEAQKKLAKAIREGRLEEQYSPAYVFAAKQQTGRGAQARANSLIEEAIQEAAELGISNATTGVPTAVPTLAEIQTRVHDEVFGEYGTVNPALADDFYFKREYAAGRAASQPDLEQFYRQAIGEVDKTVTRTEFGNQVQTAVKGAAGLGGPELANYLGMAQTGLKKMLVDSGLKNPHDFLIENFGLAINDVLRNGPDKLANASRAGDLLSAFDRMKVGTTTLGASKRFQELWTRVESHERIAKSEERARLFDKTKEDVNAARNDPEGFWARALSQSVGENELMVEDLREIASNPEKLEAVLGESPIAVLGELIAYTSTLRRTDTGRTQAGIDKLLNDGDVEGAADMVHLLPIDIQEEYRERVNSWESLQINKFRSNPRFPDARQDIRSALANLVNADVTLTGRADAIAFAESEETAWNNRVNDALVGASAEEQRTILRDAFGPWAKESKERVDAKVLELKEVRTSVSEKAAELTRALDGQGLNRLLNASELSIEEQYQYKDRFQRISDHSHESIGKSSWSSLEARLTQQLVEPGGGLAGLTETVGGTAAGFGGTTRLSPDGLRVLAEVTDEVRSGLDEWLKTAEGVSVRDNDRTRFTTLVTEKIKQLGDAAVSVRRKELQEEASIEDQTGLGDPAGAYTAYLDTVQKEEGGMTVSTAVYSDITGDTWQRFAATAGYDTRPSTIRALLGDAVSGRRGGFLKPFGGFDDLQGIQEDGAPSLVAQALSELYPPDEETTARTSTLSGTVTGVPFTPSAELQKVLESAGAPDLVGLSLAVRSMHNSRLDFAKDRLAAHASFGHSNTFIKAEFDRLGFGEPRVYDLVREALVDTAVLAREKVAERFKESEGDAAAKSRALQAMVAISEVAGVSTDELVAGKFANGVEIPEREVLDYGRVPHGFKDELELADFLRSSKVGAVFEIFGLDATDDDDRIQYELAQLRLLYY